MNRGQADNRPAAKPLPDLRSYKPGDYVYYRIRKARLSGGEPVWDNKEGKVVQGCRYHLTVRRKGQRYNTCIMSVEFLQEQAQIIDVRRAAR